MTFPKTLLWGSIIGISGVLLILLFTGYYVFSNSFNYRQLAQLKLQTVSQENRLKYYENELSAIQNSIQSLWNESEEMTRHLNPKKRRRRSKKKSRKAKLFDKEVKKITKENSDSSIKFAKQLTLFKTSLTQLTQATLTNQKKLNAYQERFKSTPSIWPVYGYIRSNYGWRVHPLTGKSQFHKGIDIPSWIGAPVQVTADGVIEFSGWGGGYGWLIVVTHDYGYRTVYAHLSEILVTEGTHVKKGEIIGKIGKTGLSTGPHVHYEVKRWRRSLSPRTYLGLDLYTAISKLW